VVRETVEEALNRMLDAEAEALCGAKRYERRAERRDTRAGHYERTLETKAGPVRLKVPKLRTLPFETAVIERYRRRESSVEEALVEMYLAGVSMRRVEDVTQMLWGTRMSASTVSGMAKKVYDRIEAWRNEPIAGEHPYVYLDGIWLKRSWGGEVANVAVLVAVGVNAEGFREILGVMEGAREDKESWRRFLRHLKDRGLKGVQLIISDRCLGLVESLGEFFPEAAWQRCMVHFYRNVFSVTPKSKGKAVATLLKAVHAQENRESALAKMESVARQLQEMKLPEAAKMVRESCAETLAYYGFPAEHWVRIRTNNGLERLLKEVRRRTRVVGAFPDSQSALMLVAARLRHMAGTTWGERKYLEMGHLLGNTELPRAG
jgi:transposase-like protein